MTRKSSTTKKINGKIFHANGPYYCPGGIRAHELKEMITNLRMKNYVRVEKNKVSHEVLAGNKYIVYLWVRKK